MNSETSSYFVPVTSYVGNELAGPASNKKKSDKPINLQNSEKRAHAQVKFDQPIKNLTSQ